jgi:hypothetical protein
MATSSLSTSNILSYKLGIHLAMKNPPPIERNNYKCYKYSEKIEDPTNSFEGTNT